MFQCNTYFFTRSSFDPMPVKIPSMLLHRQSKYKQCAYTGSAVTRGRRGGVAAGRARGHHGAVALVGAVLAVLDAVAVPRSRQTLAVATLPAVPRARYKRNITT